jgi:hypothetical protein
MNPRAPPTFVGQSNTQPFTPAPAVGAPSQSTIPSTPPIIPGPNGSVAPPPLTTQFNPKQHAPIHPKTKTGFVQGYDSQAQSKAYQTPQQPYNPQQEQSTSQPQQNSWGWSSLLSTATKSLETAKNLAGSAATVVGTNETVRGFYKNVTPELEKLCMKQLM